MTDILKQEHLQRVHLYIVGVSYPESLIEYDESHRTVSWLLTVRGHLQQALPPELAGKVRL